MLGEITSLPSLCFVDDTKCLQHFMATPSPLKPQTRTHPLQQQQLKTPSELTVTRVSITTSTKRQRHANESQPSPPVAILPSICS